MPEHSIAYTQYFDEVMTTMTSEGLLLGAYDAHGKPNLMTIGWGAPGTIWGVPVWVVLVRPSRYTFGCINHSGCFTVNVPTRKMHRACAFCGSKSGRDVDKFTECNLTAEKAAAVHAPIVAECPLVYECSVVHRNDVVPDALADEIRSSAYPEGDYHRVFYGKILRIRTAPDVAALLRA